MLTPGAGLGDGEAPERGWGELNPLATSTREMGPGTRRYPRLPLWRLQLAKNHPFRSVMHQINRMHH
jgi:hypothetical protein